MIKAQELISMYLRCVHAAVEEAAHQANVSSAG
jgi:hypothetical protein